MDTGEALKTIVDRFKDIPTQEIEYLTVVQVRKHKKKRINKKWLKKYGLKALKKNGIGKKVEIKPEDYPQECFPMSDLTFVIEKSDSPIKVKYE